MMTPKQLGEFAGTGSKAERFGSRLQHIDCRCQEIVENCGFADLLTQLLRRFGIKNRLVGRAQRRKRPCNIGVQDERPPGRQWLLRQPSVFGTKPPLSINVNPA